MRGREGQAEFWHEAACMKCFFKLFAFVHVAAAGLQPTCSMQCAYGMQEVGVHSGGMAALQQKEI